MNRRRADTVVGGLVAAVLLVGGVLSWQAYQQQQAFDRMGSMMGTSMGAVHGTNPLWYVLGTLLVSAVIGGGYLVVREELIGFIVAGRNERAVRPGEVFASLEREPLNDYDNPYQ